jgi:hypothetical protein
VASQGVARLRRRGVCTSRKRVLRLRRGAGLLAPTARVRKRAQRLHDGTITVTVPDTLWATDATEGQTEEGRCAVFVMIDHLGIAPAARPTTMSQRPTAARRSSSRHSWHDPLVHQSVR